MEMWTPMIRESLNIIKEIMGSVIFSAKIVKINKSKQTMGQPDKHIKTDQPICIEYKEKDTAKSSGNH